MFVQAHRHAFRLILLGYLLLGAVYAITIPIYEAPDESYHFALIQRIANDFTLPVQRADQKRPEDSPDDPLWFQEGSQPPLYYLISAGIVRLAEGHQPPLRLPVNDHAAIGIGLARQNNNVYLHHGAGTDIPAAVSTAFYLVRWFSLILGMVTLIGVWGIARRTLPAGIAPLVTVAFVAFNPQFLFMTASVNNDNLVAAFSALGLWGILAFLKNSGNAHKDASLERRLVILLGILMGMAALAKLSGLLLYPTAFAALGIAVWKRQISLRRALFSGTLWLAAFALIAGWWYIRNLTLYGDPTGTSRMIQIIGARETPYTLETFLREMEGLRISFWALFGWFNVIGAGWLYPLMDGLTALAVIGGIIGIARLWKVREWDRLLPFGVLALHSLIIFAALIQWTRQTPGTQGRLLFPALGGFAALMIFGWVSLLRLRIMGKGWLSSALMSIGILPLITAAVISPFTAIRSAYAPPLTVEALPAEAVPLKVRVEGIRLLGFHIDAAPVLPGESAIVTLYYRGAPDPRNLRLSLTRLGWRDDLGNPYDKINAHPGGGNLPTSAFQPGVIYKDTYGVAVDPLADAPAQFAFEVTWSALSEGVASRLPLYDDSGTALASLILRGGTLVNATPPPSPAIAQRAIFGGVIAWHGYTLSREGNEGTMATLDFVWEGLAAMDEDFNILVHLLPMEGESGTMIPIRQADHAPRGGLYPTSAWAVGVPFADRAVLDLAGVPSGSYQIVIGVYRLGDFTRLPVEGGGDTVTLKDTVQIR
ncbi:MAG TPA: DUF2142 domain-containing protein [Aggregatilineales bacterium]|nr:DUF2142 domain-containing protein [Anaerolineales bacterium]HRE46869.1 DUF2142 domain-containing protein [Aggregatilineales bacterium]